MDKRQIDGVTYVPQEDMQRAFEERLQKVTAARITAEDRAAQLEGQLDEATGRLGTLDTLNSRISELENSLDSEKSRFSRHTAMADNGWTDPELRSAVEWSYDRAMSALPKKDHIPLAEWLSSIRANPDTAPKLLRPHLIKASPEPAEPAAQETAPPAPTEMDAPTMLPPRTNTGARPAPVKTASLIDRGMNDLEFYRQNREAILKEISNQK